ncbi:MAG TPA: O-antigen ligase family protein [Thermoanaerobaculia bacterium]|nr:O-antigen ligase family protein [Thermoanaerobaculia bacterium]
MAPETRRTILRHALAVDLVIVACGIGMLAPTAPLAIFLAFLAAVAVSAWFAEEEAGLAATAYSVLALSIFFREAVDVTTLTAFAATGAAVSAFSRAARQIRQTDAAAAGVAPAPRVAAPLSSAAPFMLALPLLIVVLYVDISDVLMSRYPVPSLLQPLVVLLAVIAWKYRAACRPLNAAIQPPVIMMALYAIVVFASSSWAVDLRGADAWFAEVVKGTMICVLATSVSVSWSALKRGFNALIVTCTVMSIISLIQVSTGLLLDAFFGIVKLDYGNIHGEYSSGRAAGPPVSDPNFYARILMVAIPLAIALGIEEKRPRWRYAYFAAAAIVTGGTLATYSRGAMITLIAMGGMLIVALRIPVRYTAGAALAVLLIIPLLPTAMRQRFLSVGSALPGASVNERLDSSVAKRKLLMGVSLAMFDDHLIGGAGAGNFAALYDQYAPRIGMAQRDYTEPGSHEFPHGLYFELASETGILGLLTFCGAALAAFLLLLRARHVLLARGEPGRAAIASAVGVALAGYLIASVVLHESHVRYYGLYLGLAAAVARLSSGVVAAPEEVTA